MFNDRPSPRSSSITRSFSLAPSSSLAPNAVALTCALALFVSVGPAGCTQIRGSGVKKVETRKVGAFHTVKLSGSASLTLRVDPEEATGTVEISGDDDIVPKFKSEVTDQVLFLGMEKEFTKSPNLPLAVSAVVAELRQVSISGAAEVVATEVTGDVFIIKISGAAKVHATGNVDRVEVKLSGAGDVALEELIAKHATVAVSGAALASVHATESVEASVSGAGRIRYSGKPPKVKKSVSGAGSISAR